MNSEPKAFASLSSGLLARKGAARPAMRPQGFGQGASLEDLGWNDMGFEAPKPAIVAVRDDEHDAFGDELPEPALRNPLAALTPIASPVHDQHAEIEDRFGASNEDEDGAAEDGEVSADDEDYLDETAEIYEPKAEAAISGHAGLTPSAPTPVDTHNVVPVTFQSQAQPAPTRESTPIRQRAPRAAPGSKGKAAFTLRLDAERHLKLRLACAIDGRSAQMLVTEALDVLLGSMPELAGMAERAPKKKAG